MPIENIQRLFTIITAEQMTSYLKHKGWQISDVGDALSCQMADGTGETQLIAMPAQTSHPRFRKQLPNVIFKLAVIEQREAIDIANAIYESAQAVAPTHNTPSAAVVAATTVTSTFNRAHHDGASTQVVFKNTSDAAATLHVSLDRCIDMSPGQSVCLENSKASHLVVKFSGQVYLELADGSTAADCKLWWQSPDVPAVELRELWIMQFLASALDRDGHMLGQKADKLSAWQAAVQRYLFALTGLGQSEADARSWRLATASLISEVAQSLTSSPHWQNTLYDLTLRLAAIGKQRLMADAMAADQLWRVATSDSTVAPQATFRWLGNATASNATASNATASNATASNATASNPTR